MPKTTLHGVQSLRSGLTFSEAREASGSYYGGGVLRASLAATHCETAARTHEMAHAACDTAGIVGEQGRVPTPNYSVKWPDLCTQLCEDLVVEHLAAKAGQRKDAAQAEAVIAFFRSQQRESERTLADITDENDRIECEAHIRYCKGKVALAGVVSGLRGKSGIPAIAQGCLFAQRIIDEIASPARVAPLREQLAASICQYLGLKPLVTPTSDTEGDGGSDDDVRDEPRAPRLKQGVERTESGAQTVEITYLPHTRSGATPCLKARQRVRSRGSMGASLADTFVRALVQEDASILTRQDRFRQRAGCVVVIDCSGSMVATVKRIQDLIAACPAASVYCYSGGGCDDGKTVRGAIYPLCYKGNLDTAYARCLAQGGNPWETVCEALGQGGGRGGNDIDAAAIAYAISRHPTEPLAVLTDGQFCGGVEGQDAAANALCTRACYKGLDPTAAATALKAAARRGN